MFILRAIYFLLIGWWLALLWGWVAYLACASYVLLPVGTVMFNRLPFVLTLKPGDHDDDGYPDKEFPFIIRVIWFFVVGWWLGLVCFKFGYLLCLTIIFMPFGIWLLHRVPEAMTLRQAS